LSVGYFCVESSGLLAWFQPAPGGKKSLPFSGIGGAEGDGASDQCLVFAFMQISLSQGKTIDDSLHKANWSRQAFVAKHRRIRGINFR
jgi:hypothetical protein